MTQSNNNPLPHRAHGMDIGRFSWEVRPDGKLHLFDRDRGAFHWTVHPGTTSSVLDLHETLVNSDGIELHNTLFMIELQKVNKLLNELAPIIIPGLFSQFRPLRLTWLRRRNIRVARHPASTDAELAAVTYRNRRKRLEFDKRSFEAAVERLNSPDDLLSMADGIFTLLAIRRWGTRSIGIGLKATDTAGVVHLLWARPGDLVDWGLQLEQIVKETAAKYLIPPEDYPKYLRL